MLIKQGSLSRTVDAVTAAYFEGGVPTAAERARTARWIAARQGLPGCLARAAADPRTRNPGLFCCGKCTVGLWRNLLSGGLDRREERLRRGALHLRSVRDGEPGWRRFPFWYTVLALSEMDSHEARAELKYAAPALEHAASRTTSSAVYPHRRQELAARTLNNL